MKHDELVERQQRLQLRSAALRVKLTDQTQDFKQPLLIADKLFSGMQWLWHRPEWSLAGLLLVLAVRPRRFFSWGGRLWWAWRSFKRIQN